jgi:chromosome segregation ATPase
LQTKLKEFDEIHKGKCDDLNELTKALSDLDEQIKGTTHSLFIAQNQIIEIEESLQKLSSTLEKKTNQQHQFPEYQRAMAQLKNNHSGIYGFLKGTIQYTCL